MPELRCSNNKLAIQRSRGTTDRARRYCKYMYCTNLNINVLEDEFHVAMLCPLYEQLRGQLLTRCTVPPHRDMFLKLMTDSDVNTVTNIGCFVYNMFNMHKAFNVHLQYDYIYHNILYILSHM